jgi:hypothetical protein
MALVLKDRVLETSQTSGTGTLTLTGAVPSFQSFSSAIGNGNTTYYTISDDADNQWEVGIGTVGAGTLTRDTVLSSSNGGARVNFGTSIKNVFCDYPASKAIIVDASGNVSANAFYEGFTNTAASATQITLTSASTPVYVITGSGGQTFQLPNATTLPIGASFSFNNNQSSGAITVNNNSGTLIVSIPSGAYTTVSLLTNSVAAGTWDTHDQAPSNVSWSTNTLNYAGSITNATWNGNTVAYNRGGTGQSSAFVAGGVAYGASTSALGVTSAGTSGQVLTSAGAGTPTFSSALTGLTIDNSVIGGTTPAAGTFTTITGQTEVLRGTGTNLFTYSNTFTDAAWTKTLATAATTVATTDPTGGSNAYIITATGTGASGVSQTFSNSNGTYTLSVYAKAGTSTWLRLYTTSSAPYYAWFDLTNGVLGTVQSGVTATITSVGNGWYRCSITGVSNNAFGVRLALSDNSTNATNGTYLYIYGAQLEIGSVANTYIPTTTTAVYGTPTLSFSGVAGLGLQSDGSLYVSPAGTGAIQAQATTSSTVGGNARGANAVDWQTTRGSASQIAGAQNSVIAGGANNLTAGAGAYSFIGAGYQNTTSGAYDGFLGGGGYNNLSSYYSVLVGGYANAAAGTNSFLGGGVSNSAAGYHNIIVGGYSNSGTSASAVTTQSGTMNGTTAVTLSGSNANIKVGQIIQGTSITGSGTGNYTYVAAISGTSLTLSQAASGSSTSTLSFYTPHGVVVGGGNNQATGSYSFIGGGGDAGTAANKNVASGDWSFVGGGRANLASGEGSIVVGGGEYLGGALGNQATSAFSTVVGGIGNRATSTGACVLGGYTNTADGAYSAVFGFNALARGIQNNFVISSRNSGSINGAAQVAILPLSAATTDATPTVLLSNTSAAGTTNQLILPNNAAYTFKGTMIANVTGGGDTSSWEFRGCIKRGANAASTALVGTPRIDNIGYDAGATLWSFTLTADTTNGGLAVTVTGLAGTTIRWVAKIETCEVTY